MQNSFKISKGYDHFNDVELFHVVGINNEYNGEYHRTEKEAQTELNEL
jgi:hypothetical protein